MSSFVCLFFSQYFLLYSVLAMNTNSHLLCVSTFGLKILFFNPTMCIIRITIPNSSCFLSAWYVLYHFHSLLISVIVSDKLHISNVLFFFKWTTVMTFDSQIEYLSHLEFKHLMVYIRHFPNVIILSVTELTEEISDGQVQDLLSYTGSDSSFKNCTLFFILKFILLSYNASRLHLPSLSNALFTAPPFPFKEKNRSPRDIY